MRKPQSWFRIQAKAEQDEDAPSSADVYIYEEIGERWYGGGVGAKTFASQIDELDVDTIHLYLNSPGGAAWDGITIMNSLRRHKARIEVTVDGLAASAASVIAMAGDHITMNRGSQLMIHDAWGFAQGDAQTMAGTADLLSKLSDSIADTYAARAGQERTHWRDLMKAETWYTAEEAVTAGLADEWADAPAAQAAFDLSKLGFAYAGRQHAPAPRLEAPELPSSSEPGDPNRKENVVAYDDLKAGLRERLGVTDAAADDTQLLAAVDEALDEQASNDSRAVPEGAIVVDATAFAELQSAAAEGREARKEQIRSKHEGIVNEAVKEGRIAPAARDGWLASIEKDEQGITTLLNSLPKNTIPVAELGHSAGDKTTDEALYASAWGEEAGA
ncbi:head maturation protease, ClpP-related [Pseudoclavibacter sp. RFBB5]|uniref:head maturation protease, ClpP-related n=1 Tax=Pseudoclavibacter sp. RFBB5 TaxID=2080574 RepID=UPI000CE81FD1|nr:head maturation protease, ClpP-related [Pseudoclavibacter sp. RFBB5]PPG29652.1 peptidase [Pseudoclavibacter sp. RFBB5]